MMNLIHWQGNIDSKGFCGELELMPELCSFFIVHAFLSLLKKDSSQNLNIFHVLIGLELLADICVVSNGINFFLYSSGGKRPQVC